MYYVFFKRGIDIVFSLLAIALLFPVFILIALLIMISERTFNVFYVSIRIGQNGKPFRMYKFRTMKINCYEKEIFVKAPNDERITKIGRLLRNTSFDEMPQFFNVLKGDMSIVGNRPLLTREAAFVYRINCKRFDAPAGITGLWQINKYRAKTVYQRIALDAYYSKNITFKTDMYIMLKTMIQMFKNY